MGAMAHDEEDGVSIDAGRTRTLESTFTAPGETCVGCHEPGHYDAGMMATIAMTSRTGRVRPVAMPDRGGQRPRDN